MHRVAVFIDGGYLDRVLDNKRQGNRIDYHKLVDTIVEQSGTDRKIIRVYYYHCLPYQGNPPTQEQREKFGKAQGFFRALQRTSRFEVRMGRLAFRGNREDGTPIFEQKRVDLMIGLDLMSLAAKHIVDEVFLVAGDSDFVPAVNAVKKEGIVVYLVHGDTPHDDLLDEVDERISITQEIVSACFRLS
ncbi:NYN domain-containing protein [Chloroflexota bacterium]